MSKFERPPRRGVLNPRRSSAPRRLRRPAPARLPQPPSLRPAPIFREQSRPNTVRRNNRRRPMPAGRGSRRWGRLIGSEYWPARRYWRSVELRQARAPGFCSAPAAASPRAAPSGGIAVEQQKIAALKQQIDDLMRQREELASTGGASAAGTTPVHAASTGRAVRPRVAIQVGTIVPSRRIFQQSSAGRRRPPRAGGAFVEAGAGSDDSPAAAARG